MVNSWRQHPKIRQFDCGLPPRKFDFALSFAEYHVLNTMCDSRGQSVVLKGHAGAVRSVDFSHDSRHLITASDDKTAKVPPQH